MTFESLELLETHLPSDAIINSEFGSGHCEGQETLEQNQTSWQAPLFYRNHF